MIFYRTSPFIDINKRNNVRINKRNNVRMMINVGVNVKN